jgi:hypothetical protein
VRFFLFVLPLVFVAQDAGGQSYTESCAAHVDNATVYVPETAASLEEGDTLSVREPGGGCAGYGVWKEGRGAVLAAAGANEFVDGGYQPGDSLRFEVYDVSAGFSYNASATYVSCENVSIPICEEGLYEDGTFHKVSSLSDSTITRTVRLADGWNFSSVPVSSGQSFGDVFPECTSAFVYDSQSGYTSLSEEQLLSSKKGVAVKCEADTTEVSGAYPSSEMRVAAGWNLIGSVPDSVAVGSVASEPPGIVSSEFFRHQSGSGYQIANALRPGLGHWVKTTQAGTLRVSDEPLPKSTQRQKSEPAMFAVLIVAGQEGSSAPLRVYERLPEAQSKRMELPPLPPREVFDVRFESDRLAAELSNRPVVQTQAAAQPLQLRLKGPKELVLKAETDQGSEILTTGAETALRGAKVQLSPATSKAEYKLGRPSPHPIRREGTVNYSLEKSGRVTIRIYDVLGRKVQTLVDGRKDAGFHKTTLRAESLASGRYILRMQSGSFEENRAVTVVR